MTHKHQITPNLHRVIILGFDDAQLLDIAGPLQAFASANDYLTAQGKPEFYKIDVVGLSNNIRTSSGLRLYTQSLNSGLAPIDTLILPGGAGVYEASKNPVHLKWIREQAPHTRRIVSICTGAFIAGEAGLLEGRSVVTHWLETGNLAAKFPNACVKNNPIFHNDDGFWSSAGVTSGIDLTLALLEEDIGYEVSLAVARDLVVFLKRSGGQSQYSNLLMLQSKHASFEGLHGWIMENLSGNLNVAVLADFAGMSERTFIRKYKAVMGVSPASAVESIRIESARELLVSSQTSIKEIARSCGFGSAETMRRSFMRRVEISPQSYRDHFAGRQT